MRGCAEGDLIAMDVRTMNTVIAACEPCYSDMIASCKYSTSDVSAEFAALDGDFDYTKAIGSPRRWDAKAIRSLRERHARATQKPSTR